jgi:dipeptidyl aminopeptidase/acylaminoacyl peptidase
MVLRSHAQGLPPISRMTVFPDTCPRATFPTSSAGPLSASLPIRTAAKKLADLSIIYSGGASFLVESTAGASPENYGTLWRWRTALRDKYEKQRHEVEAKGLTASTVLTRKGYDTHSPAYSPDGSRMAYLEANGDEYPGIYVMNADGTNDRKVAENAFPMSASGMTAAWSADGSRLYYTKAEIERNTDYYDEFIIMI